MKEKFLKKGYTLYNQFGKDFLQKSIRDNDGNKKYFINISIHDFRDLKSRMDHLKNDFPDFGYEGDVQFNLKDDTTFNIHLLDVKSVEQVEKFYEDIFQKLDCRYYDD
jgi:hypothetical protein